MVDVTRGYSSRMAENREIRPPRPNSPVNLPGGRMPRPSSWAISREVGCGPPDSGSCPRQLISIKPGISAAPPPGGGQARCHSGFSAGWRRHFRPQRAPGPPRYRKSPDYTRLFPPELECPNFKNHGPSPPRHVTLLSGPHRCVGSHISCATFRSRWND